MVNIEKLAQIAEEYAKEYYTSGFTAICTSKGKAEVQLTKSSFLETFNTYTVTNRECTEFPFMMTHEVKGTKFFCISERSCWYGQCWKANTNC